MKLTQLERAIQQLESEKAVLQLAIDRLKQQAAKAPRVRKPKVAEG
jgi:hypothetical protein